MKAALLVLMAGFAFGALAEEATAVRQNCFYQDSYSGYFYGAVANSEAGATRQALRSCQRAAHSQGHSSLTCKFAGCRALSNEDISE